jgi:hypothetical protein
MVRERFGRETREEADRLRQALYKALPDIPHNLCDYTQDFRRMIRLAKEYNKLQEAACNSELTERQIKREAKIESDIATFFDQFGVTVSFSGDPRGFCVKIHAPDDLIWNTLGGAEAGYGIGN